MSTRDPSSNALKVVAAQAVKALADIQEANEGTTMPSAAENYPWRSGSDNTNWHAWQGAINALDIARERVAASDALRPPCPTCGGTQRINRPGSGGMSGLQPCPDCVDGKASIEQLAATWRAVVDALAELEAAYARREHGGVAQNIAIQTIKAAVKP